MEDTKITSVIAVDESQAKRNVKTVDLDKLVLAGSLPIHVHLYPLNFDMGIPSTREYKRGERLTSWEIAAEAQKQALSIAKLLGYWYVRISDEYELIGSSSDEFCHRYTVYFFKDGE